MGHGRQPRSHIGSRAIESRCLPPEFDEEPKYRVVRQPRVCDPVPHPRAHVGSESVVEFRERVAISLGNRGEQFVISGVRTQSEIHIAPRRIGFAVERPKSGATSLP